MNKQELIKKYEGAFEKLYAFPVVTINAVLEDLRQLDEPQKVTIPQFVADLIEYCKTDGIALGYALYCSGQASDKKVYDWIVESLENQEIFARAWLDGYTVEVEKRYRVNVKNVRTRQGTLNRSKKSGVFIFSNPEENNLYGTKFTRKELEDAGFGEVFNSPLFEVEEVE